MGLTQGRTTASRSSITWEVISEFTPIKNLNRKLSFRRRCWSTDASSPNERSDFDQDKVRFKTAGTSEMLQMSSEINSLIII